MCQKIKAINKRIGKTAFIAIVAVLIANTTKAQSEQTFAIYTTFKYSNNNKYSDSYKNVIGAKMVSAIMQEGNYTVADKTEIFTVELSKEHDSQVVATDNQIAKLGEKFDFRFVIVVDVSEVIGYFYITARMINVQTGLITAKTKNDRYIDDIDDLTKLSKYIVIALIGKDKTEYYEQQEIITNGITINGVTWATKNLGAFNPEDYGKYYTWEQAKDACPKGWRLPTLDEIESLYDVRTIWTTQNDKTGYKFFNGSDFVFFPAAGFYNTDGSYNSIETCGYYWSTDHGRYGYANFMLFRESIRGSSRNDKTLRLCVRCVAE